MATSMGEARWADVAGVRTRYFREGAGTPVVLLHGGSFGARDAVCTAWDWAPVFGRLAEGFDVVAPDRLGQGFTGQPLRDADYTMDASVQHTAALLKSLGKGPYHLVGHSRGGYVAARLALEYPELARTCTIISSGTLAPGIGRNHIVLRNLPLPLFSRESQRWALERYSFDPKIVDEPWLDDGVAAAKTEGHKLAVRKMQEEGLERSQFTPQLGRQRGETRRWILDRGMPCPTLLVWGLNDPTADLDNGKFLLEMLMRKQRQSEFRLFNRAGHFVFREQPAAFARMFQHYFRQHA